ncbi:MAG: glycosyltransferase family 39 protein, partial [candidate division Zixibacteria bacterium]|nr:glycosyltransferase family 39 protein [candidate division Zixibacteria bacterium]
MTSRFVANWRGSDWAARGLILLAAAVIFSGYLANEQTAASGLGFSSDDAWIHFRFAQNLISGQGFSYNAGQPVAGSTAPLWTLVCAGFLGILGNPVWAGKLAGFLSWVALLWGVFALVRDLTGSKIASWGATLLTLLNPRVIWGALSGLEVMLYSALIVWALVLHFRAKNDHRRLYYLVTLLLFLAGVTRPELFSLIPVFWIDRWVVGHSDAMPHARGREIALSLGVGALVLAPYFAFNLWSIGKLLPLTFYAKLAPTGVWAAQASGQFGQVVTTIF